MLSINNLVESRHELAWEVVDPSEEGVDRLVGQLLAMLRSGF